PQDEVIGLQRRYAEPHRPIATGRLDPAAHGRRDGLGNLVLQGEDVPHVAIVTLRPEVASAGPIDELRRDPDPVAGSADAAFDDVGDAELAGDILRLDRPTLEDE